MKFARDLPLRLPPPFGAKGQELGDAVGQRLDATAQLSREAVLARLPGYGPDDALPYIGQERQLPQGGSETDDDYAARLQNAWAIWAGDNTPLTGKGGGAGSPLGLLNALSAAGFATGETGATLVQQCGRDTAGAERGYAQLDDDGELVLGTLMECVNRIDLTGNVNPRPGWTFNAAKPNFWTIFGIVFPEWPGGALDAALLNSVVVKWRPAKDLFVGTWTIEAGRVYGWPLERTYGADGVYGGNTVTFYPGPNGEADLVGYYHL